MTDDHSDIDPEDSMRPEDKIDLEMVEGDWFDWARLVVEMRMGFETLPDGVEDFDHFCVAFDYTDREVPEEAYSVLVSKSTPITTERVSVLEHWEKFRAMTPVSTPLRRDRHTLEELRGR